MDYNSYSRGDLDGASVSRVSARDRDDYRASDPYRDRRRSPPPDRRRDRRDRDDRDRRRSRSPAPIDRYQPDRVPRDRDDYYRRDDDLRRDRRRSSPDRMGGSSTIDRYVPNQPEPVQLLTNPLPDPMKLDFQVGFTWFAEWWRTEQRIKEEKEYAKTGRRGPVKGDREMRADRDAERPKIQAAYDQYKENLQKQQAQTFVRLHKHEDWFRERYVAEVHDSFRGKLMDFRKGLFAQWEQDLSNGVFDEFTLEGIYKSESNGLGGILEKEEGETSAAAEVLGVGDLLPLRGGDIRDPVAQLPTLLIKTIGPTVTREKLEAFSKEHLGEGEGGYKHLSLSDPNPLKRCHRMGWVILNGEDSQEQEMTDSQPEQTAGAEAGAEAGEADGDNKPEKPKSTSERGLEKINGKTIEDAERGNFTVHCALHRPPDAPRKKALWDLFSAPERIERDLELATRLVRKLDNEMGEEYFGVAKIGERVHHLAESGQLQPPAASKPEENDEEKDEGEEEEEGMIEDEIDDEELLKKKKSLDLLVEYLRRVYNFCFFCVFESDSVHELQRKCPGGHLRRPRASLTTAAKETARASASGEAFPLRRNNKDAKGDDVKQEPGEEGEMEAESPVEEKKFARPSARNTQQLQRAFNWVKTFEEKILQILEPDQVDIRKIGGVPLEEGVEEELLKFVKQEDANKFRCKVPECTKLFKGTDFWRKHVEKRHEDFYARVRSEIELVNIYVLDPAHIAPSRSDANSNGHFPIGNSGQPTGTPRGFSLNSQYPMGFPMAAGMPSAATPTGFNGAGMFAPGMTTGWGPPGSATNPLPGMMGGVGPMRHGRYQGGYRMAGPYARPDGRSVQPSYGSSRAMEGGLVGPPQATAGRSLRSYEDLDATGGKEEKTAELDY